ncbi:MAG: malectin domain-containing carbohydrate-binding protein [Terracidiphilus sp.]
MKDRMFRITIVSEPFIGLMLVALFSAGPLAVAQNSSIFGPNVYVFTPSDSASSINSTLTTLAGNSQFSTSRYAVLFEPGTYTGVEAEVGYYESITGLGETPSAVNISQGYLESNETIDGNDTQTFWRSMENLEMTTPGSGTLQWGVSQGTSLRRMMINNPVELTDSGCNYSSGGFIADSKVTGNVDSCSQQQWFTRNSTIGSWTGSVWNMVFAGVEGAPFSNYPSNTYTVLPTTPISREKPFLYVDQGGDYRVFVPTQKQNSSGISWSHGFGEGYSLPIDDFFIAQPATALADINKALAFGKNLILTPGIYQYSGAIEVTRPDTIVLGMGYATLVPQAGTAAIDVADVDGVRIAGLLIDAGPVNSPVLLQIGNAGRWRASHAWDPTSLSDVFFRIAGATPGTATTTLEIDSNDVILDNIWAWRADHGNGVGWTVNVADHGLVVNGDNVTALGLFVEHYEQNQVVWNGENGMTIFYQSELPYDVPSQSAWMNGTANGYSSYSVSDPVLTHAGYGLGVYSFFDQGIDIVEDSDITVPNTEGVTVTHAVAVFITGSGSTTHVVDDAGGSVQNGTQTSFLPFYQGVPCEQHCPVAPPAPTGLTATYISPDQVDLKWVHEWNPLVRYSVFRSLNPGFTPSAQNQLYSGLRETRYTDTGVNPAAIYYYSVEAVSDEGTSDPSNVASAAVPSSGGPISTDVLDINAGGGATGSWVADEFFTGGTEASTGAAINASLIPNPAPQAVYQTNRYGAFTYTIPGLTANASYIVDLHFAESYWTMPGQRQFNVLINGDQVLKNFDIVAYAGAIDVATVQSFAVTADNTGTITIQFVPGAADNPQINGIQIGIPCTADCPVAPNAPMALTAAAVSPNEVNLAWTASSTAGVTYNVFRSQEPGILPTGGDQIASGLSSTSYSDNNANPSTTYYYAVEAFDSGGSSATSNYATAMTPTSGGVITSDVLDINAGGEAVGEWVADEDFSGGTPTSTSSAINTSHVSNPAPLAVYQTNRYGAFTYTIPGFAPGATYIVDLHFAETYWTGPGLRLFNVLINGKQVLTNYDMFASAGGEFIATVQSFVAIADATGTITIQFVPGAADNPQINGIEIGTGTPATP